MSLKYRMHGYDTIKQGACGADGAMGASLAEIGAIVPDSVVFEVLEPELTEIFVEGTDEPDILDIAKGGLKSVTVSTRDVSVANMESFFGGSTAVDRVWSAPVRTVKKFQSVELVGKYVDGNRIKITIPRALVTAKLTGSLQDAESGVIDINYKVGTPVNASGVALSPYQIEYEADA